MRIMLVGPYPPPYGGISVHIQRLKYYLEKKGHLCFICNYENDRTKVKKDVIAITSIKKIWKRKGNLFWETKRLDPDIIHIHHCGAGFFEEMKPVLYWKLMRKRIFITFHGGSFPQCVLESGKKDLLGLRLLLRMVEKIFCINEKQKNIILKKFDQGSQKKISIISPFLPPIEVNEQKTEPLSIHFFECKKKIITVIGAWKRYHEFECVLGAFSLLLQEDSERGLVLLVSSGGDVSYKNEILDLIKMKKLEGNVLILEDVSDIAPYLKKSNIFIRSSCIDSYSVSIAEAIWFGIPVIANDAVKRPFDVITFKDADAKNLYEKINDLDDNSKSHVARIEIEKNRLEQESLSAIGIYN